MKYGDHSSTESLVRARYGVKIEVDYLKSRSELQIADVREDYETKPEIYTFRPRTLWERSFFFYTFTKS